MNDLHNLSCQHCGKHFKRQDHRDRHELSHGKARFRCKEQSCGMRFHRQDVLKRHELVHQCNSAKRRRQARRGTEPQPFIVSTQSQDVHVQGPSGSGSVCEPLELEQSNSVTPSTDPSSKLPLDSFSFCLLHFQQTYARRWPFIHHTSLHRSDTVPENLLAMSALGGCGIAEYRSEARKFFQEAQHALNGRERTVRESYRGLINQYDPMFYSNYMLPLFQTKILLLEYAIWYADDDARQWALATTFELASITIPQFTEYIEKTAKADEFWGDWVREEQCIRALWTFYCVTQKASHLYPCAISTLRTLRHLRLPQSEILFNCSDEQIWSQSKQEFFANGFTLPSLTLKSAIHLIQCPSSTTPQALSTLTPLARHVVLVCLLDIYNSGVKYLISNFDNVLLECADDTSSVPHSSFGSTVRQTRSLWYIRPGSLFTASPPRSTDLQNSILLDHLQVLLLTRSGESSSSPKQISRELCAAATIAADILISVHEDDMLALSTKAPWLTDAPSRQYVVGFARAMVKWAAALGRQQVLSSGESNVNVDVHDDSQGAQKLLYNRVTGFLDRHVESFDQDKGYDVSEMRRFKDAVVQAWCGVLRCPAERWCSPRDL